MQINIKPRSMKNLFKYAFATFIVAGFATIALLINETVVFTIGPAIKTTMATYEEMITVFKVVAITAVVLFPILACNLIMRAFQNRNTVREGQYVVIAGMIYAIIFFIVPATVFVGGEMYGKLAVLCGAHLLGIIFGRYGNNSPLPHLWA